MSYLPVKTPPASTKDATGPKNLGKEIKLSDYRGKWLVFFFYPLDFTFVCPTEITALSDRAAEFKEFDTDILGCSTDSVYSHWAWISTPREKNGIAGIQYPLVADFTKETARAYGVLNEDKFFANRSYFLVDKQGIVRWSHVEKLNGEKRENSEILAEIAKLPA